MIPMSLVTKQTVVIEEAPQERLYTSDLTNGDFAVLSLPHRHWCVNMDPRKYVDDGTIVCVEAKQLYAMGAYPGSKADTEGTFVGHIGYHENWHIPCRRANAEIEVKIILK